MRFILFAGMGIIFLTGCIAKKQPLYISEFQNLMNESAPSELDKLILTLANKNFHDISSLNRALNVKLIKIGDQKADFSGGGYDLFFAEIRDPKKLFDWVTYEQSKYWYSVTLSVGTAKCFDGLNLGIIEMEKNYNYYMEHVNTLDVTHFSYRNNLNKYEKSHDTFNSLVRIERFKLSGDNYYEYYSENVVQVDGSTKSCIRRIKIYH